ncbi:MAG: hypothetical protein IMZ61_08425 [Planctomycetes bacterium]|nr:hypothetical protein [Planctomycetota bacterium]
MIEAISAPLGFFVLALLIVETFLTSIPIIGKFEKADLIKVIWIGVGMFVLVTAAVWILVWFKPTQLTFDKEAHLLDKGKIPPYGSDTHHVSDPRALQATSLKDKEKSRE